MTASDLIKLIPAKEFQDLGIETKVDEQVKKLSGEVIFKLILFAMLNSEKVSLRVLETFINSGQFKSFTHFDIIDGKFNSIRDRICNIKAVYFERLFQNIFSIYNKELKEEKGLSKSDSTYIALAAVYQLKSGFYFTAQSYKLLNDNTSTVSAGAIGAGINFKLAKKLSTDLSYSHSFYPSYSPLLQAGNADNASLVFSYDSWVKPSVTADYAFGKTSDAFVTGGISKSINLFSITPKDVVTITPAANIVAGTQHFYQTYITEKKLHDSLLGIVPLIPVFGNPGTTSHADSVVTTNFNALSYNFKIPIAYNRAHYLIQAEYQLSILSKHVAANKQINSFLTFSFYYQF